MVQETTGSEAIESSTKLPTEPTTSLIEKTDSTRDERASELVWRVIGAVVSGGLGLPQRPLSRRGIMPVPRLPLDGGRGPLARTS